MCAGISTGVGPRAKTRDLTLSSLSTADEIVRILSAGTPQTAKMPSRIFRWFSCEPARRVNTLRASKNNPSPPHLDGKVTDLELLEDFASDGEAFRVRQHRVVDAGNIEVLTCARRQPPRSVFRIKPRQQTHTLVELAHATLAHGRLVAAVHLGDVVPLDVRVLRAVHGEEPSERDLSFLRTLASAE